MSLECTMSDKFDSIIESIQCVTGFARLDAEGRFCCVNLRWAEWFELAPRRWLGEPLSHLSNDPVLAEAFARVTAGHGVVQLRRMSFKLLSGRYLLGDLALSPYQDGGTLLELHALGPEEATVPRLSESLRGFAHEIKNPLAGIRGAAQLLRRRVADPDLAELADLVIAETDRLTALANRLLRVSVKPHLSQINIHEALERVIAVLATVAGAPTLVRDFDPSLPPLRGDLDRLVQLVLNLGCNAVEAGARTLILRTRAEHGVHFGERSLRSALRVDVVDDGAGVPAAMAESLFLPLVSGRTDGSGLGLALCQEIAREHGGNLTFRSHPNDTVFTLLLPLGASHA